jgi:hypothetical protein
VPGSLNTKCLNNGLSEQESKERLVQEWNGVKPKIKGTRLIREFYVYLAYKYVKEKKTQGYRRLKKKRLDNNKEWVSGSGNTKNNNSNNIIAWMEKLLQTPIAYSRKRVTSLILSRYLINIRHLSCEQSYSMITEWLEKCAQVKPLDRGYDYNSLVKYQLRAAIKSGRLPMSKVRLEEFIPELYQSNLV